MPALLLAVALIALTILVLLLAGALAAIITGIALLNVFVLLLGAQSRRARQVPDTPAQHWRPSAFRRLPETADAAVPDAAVATAQAAPADDSVEPPSHPHSITIHRR
ncbi:MAG TPA: hypothetical protein VGI52_00880 [Solirubrobacteraceae bacterium]|jgi:hypothetical protein